MATNNPLEILTYANLSNAAYGNGAVPMGWTLLAATSSTKTGFAAMAVRNDTTGEIVVAYRGTDGIKDLTGSDLQLALQNDVPGQYPEAAAFYTQIKNEYGSNITLTGHSLGGALVQLVAAIENRPAFTYNAPGVEVLYPALPGANPNASAADFTNINNFNMAFDAVSTRGVQLGNIANYDPSSLEGLTIFASFVATAVNPSIGVLVFGHTVLGQHYIDRLEDAIATPKPTDTLNGYSYDAASGTWSMPSQDGTSVTPADAETAAGLSALRDTNIQYNEQVGQAHTWLTEYRNWQAITAQLTARYGQVWTDYDPQYDSIGWIRDANGNFVAQFQMVEENSQKLMKMLGEGGQTVNLSEGTISGIGTLFHSIASGATTLLNSVATYGPTLIDSLSLIKAIQSGEPLPLVASGLRLANDLSTLNGASNLNLSGVANTASGILSLMSLDAALERGDMLGTVTAGAQAIAFGAQAFSDSAASQAFAAISEGTIDLAAETLALQSQAVANTVGNVLPFLSIANSLAQGDMTGAAVGVVSYFVPVVGWAYAVFSIIDSLFGGDDEIPDPWGTGSFTWNGTGISYQSAGETGGNEAVANVMGSVLATLNALIERERSQNPGSQLGIIPNRMPGVGYDMSGYRYTDIDPLTGAEKHPALRFDTSGNPYNADPGSPESFQSIIEGMVYSALGRQAIAPLWEGLTARAQTDAGDPKAGLTEEERAGRDGQLAAPLTGSTQTFRPVMLDLDGDGIETVNKAASNVAFDVDDSGFMKQTGWAAGGDTFLTLDRDYNGQTNSGKEMFSNGVVDISRRGLAGMAWVDSNYDGKLTAADPVWNELKVWQDDGDGVDEAGEKLTLAALGITELNYSMGTFTRNGQVRQLASPDLEADRDGTRINVVPEGILVQSSGSDRISLLVTRIDDLTAVEANRDGVTGFEDVETIISAADLLANDTLGGFTGRDLSITGLTNLRHGTGFIDANGFVHFNPEANYAGRDAGFDYTVLASNGQTGTGGVDIVLQNVNDAPTLDRVDHSTQPVYGYTPVQYDEWGSYQSGGQPIYQPYAIQQSYDWESGAAISTYIYNPLPGQPGLDYHTTPVANEDTGAGRVAGADVDDPASSLSYEIVNQPQYGAVSLNADGTFQYTSWKEPGVPSDRMVVDGQYAGIKDGMLYTQFNLPGSAVYPTSDIFQVRITDPGGASTIQNISVAHFGPYLPPTPPGGGGGAQYPLAGGRGVRRPEVQEIGNRSRAGERSGQRHHLQGLVRRCREPEFQNPAGGIGTGRR
ncbi:hypothetical protein TPL01_21200 [Sulfuriferula plumbiphila]|uniref:Fungal lipase-like domain-containing protein n=1 Tax=Sulfuriferula plumbiphila TaxID=171865 RepID=A0A512L940_9PROT|nr:cadherin-like domain-containing protein [Sulfuriferula plumbiphila]BBP04401.1 hypothetical protein SFPGR_18230 [Sulfuriferula plumbiphila]GEP30982.1 hypothetical protein TPL01_21200 [Sulfuriferula plumbiphila]